MSYDQLTDSPMALFVSEELKHEHRPQVVVVNATCCINDVVELVDSGGD